MKHNLRYIPKEIFIPKREIVRLGERWIIYLPVDYNMLWEELKHRGKKVRVYIEIIDDEEQEDSTMR